MTCSFFFRTLLLAAALGLVAFAPATAQQRQDRVTNADLLYQLQAMQEALDRLARSSGPQGHNRPPFDVQVMCQHGNPRDCDNRISQLCSQLSYRRTHIVLPRPDEAPEKPAGQWPFLGKYAFVKAICY